MKSNRNTVGALVVLYPLSFVAGIGFGLLVGYALYLLVTGHIG